MSAIEIADYRATMSEGQYQANFKCPKCHNWCLTTNLEVYKNREGNKEAEALDVICSNKAAGMPPCGSEIGTVVFLNWRYSAPVTWKTPAPVWDEPEQATA